MTIHDDFDELAAAYLDGEATVDEVARVESDPELLAIVEEFRSVSGEVGAPVASPDDATRDRQIGAALAGFDATDRTTRTRADHANNLSDLAAARAARGPRTDSPPNILLIAAMFAAAAVGGLLILAISRATLFPGGYGSDSAVEAVTETTADAAEDTADAAEDTAEAVTGDDGEDAMEEEAMEEEAMEEAEAVEASDEAFEEAVEEAAGGEEVRLGDDDAAEDVAAGEAADGSVEVDLDELSEQQTSTSSDQDADDSGGLFPLPIEERSDFLGRFASPDEVADAALTTPPSNETASLGGDGCTAIASRIALADAVILVGTGQIIDDVTGQPANLAIYALEIAGTPLPLAVYIDECRIYVGAENLP